MLLNDATIEFVAPNIMEGEIKVDIQDVDIEFQVKFQDSALIMYVLGKDLNMNRNFHLLNF